MRDLALRVLLGPQPLHLADRPGRLALAVEHERGSAVVVEQTAVSIVVAQLGEADRQLPEQAGLERGDVLALLQAVSGEVRGQRRGDARADRGRMREPSRTQVASWQFLSSRWCAEPIRHVCQGFQGVSV